MITETYQEDIFEPERYEAEEELPYQFDLNRRTFMQVLGAGVMLTIAGNHVFAQNEASNAPSEQGKKSISTRIHLGEDGIITVMTGKIEMGQGARTELTAAAAEELQVSPDVIRMVMGDTDLTPSDGATAGSGTTPRLVPIICEASAAARNLLIELASRHWKIQPGQVQTKDGKIINTAGGESMAYVDVAKLEIATNTFNRDIPSDIEVTKAENWGTMGTSVPRRHNRDVVTGSHQYPSDITLPNMLYGKVLRAPSYGAKLTNIDLAPAQAMKGVAVVRDGDFIGCAAAGTSYQAAKAIEALAATATWETQSHPSNKNLFEFLKEKAREPQDRSITTKGNMEEGLAKSKQVLQETYHLAYIQHVPLESRVGVAQWEKGHVTVWTGTQDPRRIRRDVAKAFRMSEDNVRVICPDMGGAFGGKHSSEMAIEAAKLAQGAKRPVSLHWTREEEFTWAYFRPAGIMECRGGLAEDGSLLAWEHININSGTGSLKTPYDIPHVKTAFQRSDSPLRQGSYRALASPANTFARECFMDELASAAGKDPLAFRLAHLKDERLAGTLQAAADKFGWEQRKNKVKSQKDVGIGIACGTDKGSWVATCVEVGIDRKEGKIILRDVCQAFDCGAVINPRNLTAQVEGGLIMGLGGALTEEILFEDGKILNPKLSQYHVPHFKDIPPITIIHVGKRDQKSVGCGETPIDGIAPAIGNAIFNATGVRLRSMPLKGDEFKQA